MNGISHRVAEERSLALHQEVARRLREKPELLDRARRRVREWSRDGSVAEYYVKAWMQVLDRPLESVIAAITNRGEHATSLRQASPFAGVIDPKTRWKILRECERRRRVRET